MIFSFLNFVKLSMNSDINFANMQVGIAATQIAKHAGLTVIGTAGSAEGVELVKSIGAADFAFNHSEPEYMEQIKVLKIKFMLLFMIRIHALILVWTKFSNY